MTAPPGSAVGTPTAPATLPLVRPHATRCAPVRPSKKFRWRVVAWIAVHVVAFVHIAHWKVTGRTVTPLEPSEAMQTLELGKLNAGFILFTLSILATLILGRFFCGWACHVVAYQDACAWALKKLGLRPRPFRSRLLVLIPLGAAFYMFVWPTLNRAILQGRPAPALVEHLTTASFWETFPGLGMALLTIAVDGFLIVWFLGAKGFCTYGCPYGAIFGVADRFATGKIRVTDACEGCGHCTATCTSNVRVHEEVRLYKMVVDPGCMKCLDCVSVCPKGALYFGFGKPAIGAKPVSKRPKRVYDLPWAGEIALAVIFGVSLYAYRGLYDAVPFLLSLGLAVITAFLALAFWRLVRRPDFRMQSLALRVAGRFTPAGYASLAVIPAAFAFVGHSALVQYHTNEGERLLRRAKESPKERATLARESLDHFRWAERLGLAGSGLLQTGLGNAVFYGEGNVDEAMRRFERAKELSPRLREPRLWLANLHDHRENSEAAERELRDLLALDPETHDRMEADARMSLAGILVKRGDFVGALGELGAILRFDPGNALAAERLQFVRQAMQAPPPSR